MWFKGHKNNQPKPRLSKRFWSRYLRSAEGLVKLFRIVNIVFILGSTFIIIVIISLFTPLFSQIVAYGLNQLPMPTTDPTVTSLPPTAYVVIGGGLTNDNNNQIVLNGYSLNRVRSAAIAYHDNPLPIVLSGAEAPWMNQWLIEHGIDEQLTENASMNTCENARFTAKRTALEHIYLVTDNYHMPRARRQFALNGIYTTPISAPLPVKRDWMQPAQNLSHSRRAFYEVAAYMRDILRPQVNCRRADEVSIEQLLTPRGEVKTAD